MADYDKPALDRMTDNATGALRDEPPQLPELLDDYAGKVARYLATQFPGDPDLPRIVLACTQFLAPLGAEGVHGAVLVSVLGSVGLRLGEGTPVTPESRSVIVSREDLRAVVLGVPTGSLPAAVLGRFREALGEADDAEG